MTDRLKNAIDVLSTAYLQGNLQSGNCNACAVGNLLDNRGGWNVLFATDYIGESAVQRIRHEQYWDQPEKLKKRLNREVSHDPKRWDTLLSDMRDTGYSIHELAQIEYTFECTYEEKHQELFESSHSYDERVEKAQFEALMAVVDLLFDMEEEVDHQDKEKAKAAFA